jgi:predicted outer membrane repeat protein
LHAESTARLNLLVANATFRSAQATLSLAAGYDGGRGGAIHTRARATDDVGAFGGSQVDLRVSGCTFTDCTALTGGALDVDSGAYVSDSTFERCRAVRLGGGDREPVTGGVARVSGGARLDFLRVRCANCSAAETGGQGGAVAAVDGSWFWAGVSRFERCSTLGNGGAVWVDFDSVVTLSETVFANNSAASLGGAIFGALPVLDVSKCLFVGNQAGSGGAVFVELPNPRLMQLDGCTFRANRATLLHGGAFACQGCALRSMGGCVFEGNSADRDGGAVYFDQLDGRSDPLLSLWQSSFNGNTAGRRGEPHCSLHHPLACHSFLLSCVMCGRRRRVPVGPVLPLSAGPELHLVREPGLPRRRRLCVALSSIRLRGCSSPLSLCASCYLCV